MCPEVKITYRGWPGHFILGSRCVFHLNTLIEVGKVRVVVSTVGDLHYNPLTPKGAEMLGSCVSPHFYETMAFHAKFDDGYWDMDVKKGVGLNGKTTVTKITRECDAEAQDMHEAAIQEIIVRIRKGEIK